MSKARKRAGTATAARSPPSKKAKSKAQTRQEAETSTSTKQAKSIKKAANALQKDRQPASDSGSDAEEGGRKAPPKKSTGGSRRKRGASSGGKLRARKGPTLAEDGVEIAGDGSADSSGEGEQDSKQVDTDSEGERGQSQFGQICVYSQLDTSETYVPLVLLHICLLRAGAGDRIRRWTAGALVQVHGAGLQGSHSTVPRYQGC